MNNDEFYDKVAGCLIGGAIGDALGYPVEFIMSYDGIVARFGEGGIREYELSDGQALISDDTQMTLYTAEGIIEAMEMGGDIIPEICKAYIAWYCGQTGKKTRSGYTSELSGIPQFNCRRAPGNTCLSALQSIHDGHEPKNDSKGCGGIMRIAPIAVYGSVNNLTLLETGRLAGAAAEITHLHPISTYSSADQAIVIQECLRRPEISKQNFRDIINESIAIVAQIYGREAPYMDMFKKVIDNAVRMSDSELSDAEIIERHIGGGWVAEETLAIAIFSVLRHFDHVDDCFVCSVNHGGDSDSTGAVAGNIIGAIHGYHKMPSKYIHKLQFHDLILSYAHKLLKSNIND